jgi:hypothetical protein
MTGRQLIEERGWLGMSQSERKVFHRGLDRQIAKHCDQRRIGKAIPTYRSTSCNGLNKRVKAQLKRLRRGGQEHEVAFPSPADGWDRVVKVRRQSGQEMQGSKFEYAERMAVTNLHLGDDVRIEGEDSEGRVVISQQFYDGHDEEHIDSDNMRIARVLAMAELGFSPDDIPGDPPGASGAYRKPGYLILDAVWHNFIYRLHKDTVSAIPFDLQISRDIRRPGYHMGELDQFTEDDPDTGNPKSF